ncbi:cytochrome P450 [Sorangium sp. So ce296]|uniref:Cytochrome P450 n=1 Tax=Sorangium cellulosum TaxID=56 RepID=A0A150SWR2_SORCE|nr:hypothetical protein BE18_20725 [Sorangium cellulosum]KYF99632.1 hypothetical protein BE20_58920 [Sorangium cellulosum]
MISISKSKHELLPPGPRSPTALQTLQWLKNPVPFLEACGARYGDMFTLKLPTQWPVVVVQHPEAVKEVFALDSNAGHAGEANNILKPFLGKYSLLVLDGEEHMRQRKMMMPAFHGERMQAYGHAMIDAAHASIDTWPVGSPFAVHAPMQAITLQVILRTVVGMTDGPLLAELEALYPQVIDAAAAPAMHFELFRKDLGPWSPWGKFKRRSARGKEIMIHEIRRAREKGTAGRTDVLAMIIDAKDENGELLTEDEIHGELMTLLVAGHETTATALCWALRWLLRDAALTRRVAEEAAEVADDPVKIAKSDLLDRVVKEALRLQPIGPVVARVLKQPLTIQGRELPADIMVAPCVQLVHHRPSLYPNPTRFDPDRYVTFNPKPWEFLPFGGGLRKCIGAAFSIYEMKMVLATAFSRLSMELATDNIKIIRRGVTLAPSGGLPLVIRKKNPRATKPIAA